MVNWELQCQIWEHAIRAQLAHPASGQRLDLQDAILLVTEPLFNFPACQEGCCQVGVCPAVHVTRDHYQLSMCRLSLGVGGQTMTYLQQTSCSRLT